MDILQGPTGALPLCPAGMAPVGNPALERNAAAADGEQTNYFGGPLVPFLQHRFVTVQTQTISIFVGFGK